MILLLALLMCASLFIFPTTAAAANVAPPAVEAEIIGSLLRIRATSGFFAVEAVYINGRRFNHRVDSALVIDISQYIATGDTIAVFAVDFAGNYSNTVLLTPSIPAQPPPPNNITPDGQGEVLDHLTGEDMIEFITITTPAGNIFYLIIDHARDSNNVYFLNATTEWDLITLAAGAELAAPPHISGHLTPIVVVEPEPPPVMEEPAELPPPESEPMPTEPVEDEGGRTGMFIFLGIVGAGAFGVIYYLKILKPKKEREMYGDGGDEEADEYEDVDDDNDGNTADSDTDSDENEGSESI